MRGIQIVRARPDQAKALTGIAFAAKRHWGYPERWIQGWASQLTITPGLIESTEVWVGTSGDAAIAFYALAVSGAAVALEHLWVLPDWMGRGVGAALFDHALQRSRDLGFSVLEIESDPNALGFYEKMGARRVGEQAYTLEGETRLLPLLEVSL